jgi:hypothetical protein
VIFVAAGPDANNRLMRQALDDAGPTPAGLEADLYVRDVAGIGGDSVKADSRTPGVSVTPLQQTVPPGAPFTIGMSGFFPGETVDVGAGDHVLVYGASGAIGTAAVQLLVYGYTTAGTFMLAVPLVPLLLSLIYAVVWFRSDVGRSTFGSTIVLRAGFSRPIERWCERGYA